MASDHHLIYHKRLHRCLAMGSHHSPWGRAGYTIPWLGRVQTEQTKARWLPTVPAVMRGILGALQDDSASSFTHILGLAEWGPLCRTDGSFCPRSYWRGAMILGRGHDPESAVTVHRVCMATALGSAAPGEGNDRASLQPSEGHLFPSSASLGSRGQGRIRLTAARREPKPMPPCPQPSLSSLC